MKIQDKSTKLIHLPDALDLMPSAIRKDNYAVSKIYQRVAKSKKKMEPWIPKEYCQKPMPGRMDNFDLTNGLGKIDLQPAIDQLNLYKEQAITAIKDCFAGMGPDSVRAQTLATRAADTLKKIYEAAKCFTQIVANINNLISTYMQVVNKLIADVIAKIDELENETMRFLDVLLNAEPSLKVVITLELFDAINRCTNIYQFLAFMGELETELNEAMAQVTTLKNTDRRILLQMQGNFALLKNRINALLYFNSLKSLLKNNLRQAQMMYPMPDDFLDSVDVMAIQASNFEWSLTNTAGLYEYNMNDDLDVIKKLNKMFKEYKEDSPPPPLIIESREQSGYIFVPPTQHGLVSVGIDKDLGAAVSLIFELSINNGETIIRAVAKGMDPKPDEKIINRNYGVYLSKSRERLEYNKIIVNSETEWEVSLMGLNRPQINDLYYFKDPSTQEIMNFTIHNVTDNKYYYFPALYKVTEITHNSATLIKMDDSNLSVEDFLTPIEGKTYSISNPHTLPIDDSGQIVYFTKVKNRTPGEADYTYFAIEKTDGFINTVDLVKGENYWNVKDLPGAIVPANDIEASTWTYPSSGTQTHELMKFTLNSVILTKYVLPVGYDEDSPHSGDKIPCLNWSLSVYPSGDESVITKTRFSREYENQAISSFFLKANWGFIPVQLDTVTKVDALAKEKEKAIAKNLFGS